MIRFLFILISIALAYLGITAMSKYDTTISILIFDYKVSISLFMLCIITLIIISFSSLGIKILSMIISAPYLIAERLAGHKQRSRTKAIIESYAQLLLGNYESANRMISRLDIKNLDDDYKEHANLIAAICNRDFDKNMPMLQNLLSNKEYHDFAAKMLAKKLFESGYYSQSLQYAEQIHVAMSHDKDAMELLIRLYVKLNIWEKFVSSIQRYSGMYPEQKNISAEEISGWYVEAARFVLSEGNEEKAYQYIEKSLEHNPINLEAIEIFCKINLTNGRPSVNLSILEKAFSKSPSFELFELYCQSSTISAKEIYQKLRDLVDVIAYREIFFAIAAYLDLQEEIRLLRIDSTEMLLKM